MRIGVAFGGVSNENEVSVLTGVTVCNVLQKEGHFVLPLFQSVEGEWTTAEEMKNIRAFEGVSGRAVAWTTGGVLVKKGKRWERNVLPLDLVVNAMHGGDGEGGCLYGLCRMCRLPLLGTSALSATISLDKTVTKRALTALGFPVVPYAVVEREEACPLPFPVIVKPPRLGSSVGISVARTEEEWREAVALCLTLDDRVLVEPYLAERREFNCAVYEYEGEVIASPVEEVAGGEVLSFEDKYKGGGRSVLPALIPVEEAERIRTLSCAVYEALGMSGIVRLDFLAVGETLYIGEINTTPGSLAQYLVSDGYRHFGYLLTALCRQTLARWQKETQKTIVHTGILQNIPSNGCKSGVKGV